MGVKLRPLTTARGMTPAELEEINYNLWLIENSLNSVGAQSPIASPPSSPPATTIVVRHDQLLELTDDDHPQYLLLAGRGTQNVDQVTRFASGSLFIPASQLRQITGTALAEVFPGTTWPDMSGSAYEFVTAPASGPQGIGTTIVMPDWFRGTTLTARVVWAPKSTGGVVDTHWHPRVYLLRFVSGTTLFDASTGLTLEAALLADTTTPGKTIYVSDVGSGSLSGLTHGEAVRVGFDRDTADADDAYADSIYMYGLILEWR